MSGKYILNANGEPIEEHDLIKWARWFEGADNHRRVAKTDIREGVHVSTVFLGLDHAFGEGPPVLWETMIFGGPHDGDQWRYTSRADALAGHTAAVKVATGEEA